MALSDELIGVNLIGHRSKRFVEPFDWAAREDACPLGVLAHDHFISRFEMIIILRAVERENGRTSRDQKPHDD
jgi:hypothetical protein